MITWLNIGLLKEIRDKQKDKGVAKAPELRIYEQRSDKYRALRKLETLNLIQTFKAPTNAKIKKTFKLSELGQRVLEVAEQEYPDKIPERKVKEYPVDQ